MPSPIKLIVGLGNPGAEHTETRHNVGFWFIDTLAKKYSLTFRPESKFQSEVCRISIADIDCWLCKPVTYMNVSGQAVQAIANFYKIAIDEILVAHDEIDLNAGTVRLKKDGGHGGHNGLRDIIEKINGKNFIRLRIGVSHPGSKEQVTPHVLGRPGGVSKARRSGRTRMVNWSSACVSTSPTTAPPSPSVAASTSRVETS